MRHRSVRAVHSGDGTVLGLVVCLLSLAAGEASPSPSRTQEGPPPTPVRGAVVESREVVRRERVIGSLRAYRRAELAALEEGPLVEVPVREGQAVAAGEVLARIDTRRLTAERAAAAAELAASRANLIQLEAEVAEAREDVARFEQAGEGAVSRREVERARTALAVAEAQRDAGESAVGALEAQVELVDVQLGDAVLVAPFDAIVVGRYREAGEWVRPGDVVVTLVSAGRYEAWLDVPERFVGAVGELSGELLLELDGSGERLVARDARSVPDVDPVARTFTLIADVEAPEQRVAPGQSLSTWLPVGEASERLVVPKDALVHRAGGVAVVTVPGTSAQGERTGAAVQTPVRVLFELDREVVLAPGAIPEGALVVTKGNERVFPGTPLTIQLADDASTDTGAGAPQ